MCAQYIYKTTPLDHQAKIFRESVLKPAVSLFLQAGLGKTKIIIDKASFLYQLGRINTLVVVAPNGVHRNWHTDEIPKHMPDEVVAASRTLVYHSSKASTKKFQAEQKALLNHPGFAILLVSYEATITDKFKKWFKTFLKKRRAMMVLDESHKIKSATSQVKFSLVAMGAYAPYRRILTGTPVEIPPDIYSQIRFLDPGFWPSKGLPTKTEFDSLFTTFGEAAYGRGAKQYRPKVGYKNIELLHKWVAETGYQMSLDDAGIVLPPVIYSKRYHKLTLAQKKAYQELTDEGRTILDSGDLLETEFPMTLLLRLQQLICGYVACQADDPVQRIDPNGKNPRLEVAVDDILLELRHQAIVWARFKEDINQLMDALGDKAVRYDGSVDGDGRARAKAAFQAGDKQYIVMSSAGAEGLTLTGSKTMLFYSNDFRMISRVQKEARQHRIGQNDTTCVIDMVCEGTVDEHIIDCLRSKKELADIITGSKLKDWI